MAGATEAPAQERAAGEASEAEVYVVTTVEPTAGEEKATEPVIAVAAAEADADAVEEEPTVVAVEEDVADAGESTRGVRLGSCGFRVSRGFVPARPLCVRDVVRIASCGSFRCCVPWIANTQSGFLL